MPSLTFGIVKNHEFHAFKGDDPPDFSEQTAPRRRLALIFRLLCLAREPPRWTLADAAMNLHGRAALLPIRPCGGSKSQILFTRTLLPSKHTRSTDGEIYRFCVTQNWQRIMALTRRVKTRLLKPFYRPTAPGCVPAVGLRFQRTASVGPKTGA
jgi:hypothetical protein